MPKTSSDLWVVEGLVGWLEGRFILKVMGTNEWNYRLAKKRKSVAVQEDGTWPPLCPRGSSTGVAGNEVSGKQQMSQTLKFVVHSEQTVLKFLFHSVLVNSLLCIFTCIASHYQRCLQSISDKNIASITPHKASFSVVWLANSPPHCLVSPDCRVRHGNLLQSRDK